jgi:hypothetical protein
MLIDVKEINFKKYKRIFSFGCSFTFYMWPTWADILASENTDADFLNFGQSGAGNIMITARISEANVRFKFNEDDLIMVMWTTYCREDRYLHGRWLSPGNIFTQGEYDDEFVKKYADPKGYMIRDLGIMSAAHGFLKNISSDAFTLRSVPENYQQDMSDQTVRLLLDLYNDTLKESPISMFELGLNNRFECGKYYYGHSSDPEKYFGDYHPNTRQYKTYLDRLGIPLTNISDDYVKKYTVWLDEENTQDGIISRFADILAGRKFRGML